MDQSKIIQYLTEQVALNKAALEAYETPILDLDQEVKKMREMEAIKLRDRILELNKHIAIVRILS